MRPATLPGLLALVASGGLTVASAQGLADPTRPPDAWLPTDPKAAAKSDPAAPAKADEPGMPPLQLLLVGKTRRYAIVRGELVGEKAGEVRLVEVRPTDVTVQSERGREKLSLFPDVEKSPPRKPAGMGTPEIPAKKEQK